MAITSAHFIAIFLKDNMTYLSNISVTGSFAHQISCTPRCLLSCNSLTLVYHGKTRLLTALVFLSNQRSHGKIGDSPTIKCFCFCDRYYPHQYEKTWWRSTMDDWIRSWFHESIVLFRFGRFHCNKLQTMLRYNFWRRQRFKYVFHDI